MSDNTQQSTIAKAIKKENSEPAPTKSTNTGSGFFIGLLSLLALLLAGAGVALGYKAWLDLNTRLDQTSIDQQTIANEIAIIDQNPKLQNFKNQIENNIASTNLQVTNLAKQLQQQADAQKGIELATKETLQHVKRSQLGWGLKETEHLLRMANQNLRINRDVEAAIAALKAASTRLNELNDQRLLPVRESISKQVGKLKNFPYPDWVGISLQLDNLLAGLKQNIIKNAEKQRDNTSTFDSKTSDSKHQGAWGKLVDGVKNTINESIKVTREDEKLKMFISEQENQQAYEFLRAKLLSAKYAVTSRDDDTYHRELEAAINWLNSTDTLRDKSSIIAELEELNDINLEPELPDITEANSLLMQTAETINNSQSSTTK
jgi:uroporphyrin-3 C-methyltransferase